MKKYFEIIKKIVKEQILDIKCISDTNNKVFKIRLESKNLYAKFYEGKSIHKDNELKLYDLIDNSLLKEVYYKEQDFAIFEELTGKTLDELSEDELKDNCKMIIDNICNYYSEMQNNKTNGYGILDENLNGKYSNFLEFLKERQQNTSNTLKDYNELQITNLIFEKYSDIIKQDNSLVPIDTNFKNIMLQNDKTVKFVDPGEMISGPILMGYGDFVAHSYKTILYDELIFRLNLNEEDMKLLRIYAIFSSLNILAFLKNNGVDNLSEIIPYGNKYTFYELIKEHMKYLEL